MNSVKHLFLLLMVALTALPFKSFSQQTMLDTKLSITFENETIRSAIKRIEKESGISFAYSNLKDLNKTVSASFNKQPLEVILNSLFSDTNLSFKEIGGKITLFETSEPEKKTQKATIHGYIYDKQSSERLINANVYNPENLVGTISNNYGFYSYSANRGKVQLMVTYMGYQPQIMELDLQNDTTVDISLQIKSGELQEVTITGNQSSQVENTQMSMTDMSLQKIKKIPVILGEADVLKVIQLLPGVQAGVEGTSGIYVRGGGSDQNLYLLDGVPVYNPSHLLGIFSVFNPEALKSVKLYKGGFPARYGGRLSSVVDISMKDGNMKELKGDFSIGLITSKFTLEGPIKTDKTSFMISARRSYADLFAKPVVMYNNKKWKEDKDMGGYFHDFNLKINHIFSNRSRLYLSGYHGQDFGKYVEKNDDRWRYLSDNGSAKKETTDNFGISWGNTIASARWNFMISPKLFSNTTATFSNYLFNTNYEYVTTNLVDNSYIADSYNYHSGIRDLSAKVDFDYYPTPRHSIKFGTQFTKHLFTPGVTNITYTDTYRPHNNEKMQEGNRGIKVNEFAAFIEDDITLLPNLSLNAGFHLSLLHVDDTTYINPQPRLSLRYQPGKNWSLKTSYSRMAQHVHMLYNSGINLPTDIWVPSTKKLPPPVSDQIALGASFNLKKGLSLTVETYYKSMANLVEYKAGAAFMNGSFDWENKVEKGRGWAYGFEFLLEKTLGNTTGWIGYTWAKSERQFEFINYGKVFPSKYDRRHDISIVFTHKFSDRFDIGGTWVYGTGTTATIAFSKYPIYDENPYKRHSYYTNYVSNFEGRNNFRVPAYHRMDLGMNFHKTKKKGIRTWSISVYNIYNQQNAFLVYWKDDEKETYNIVNGGGTRINSVKNLSKLCIMPIIPTITYSYKF